MHDVLDYYRPGIDASNVMEQLTLTPHEYFVVSIHREENVDSPENLQELLQTLNALAEQYGYPVVVSTHPRTQARLDALADKTVHSSVRFIKPLGFSDYIKLQMQAACILSDSGTISEEASLLSLPAITLRNAHERPEGMDVGTLIMSGLKADSVLDSVAVVMAQHDSAHRVLPVVDDYEAGPVSKQVLRVVMSYVDYINHTVWSKH